MTILAKNISWNILTYIIGRGAFIFRSRRRRCMMVIENQLRAPLPKIKTQKSSVRNQNRFRAYEDGHQVLKASNNQDTRLGEWRDDNIFGVDTHLSRFQKPLQGIHINKGRAEFFSNSKYNRDFFKKKVKKFLSSGQPMSKEYKD